MSEATPDNDTGRLEIEDAPGWQYHSIDGDGEKQVAVTVRRDEDGCELRFTVPDVVQQGEELGMITRIVIGARERADAKKYLGG
jgi:hypothetical protein